MEKGLNNHICLLYVYCTCRTLCSMSSSVDHSQKHSPNEPKRLQLQQHKWETTQFLNMQCYLVYTIKSSCRNYVVQCQVCDNYTRTWCLLFHDTHAFPPTTSSGSHLDHSQNRSITTTKNKRASR